MPLYVKDGKDPLAAAGPSRRMVWGGSGLAAPTLILHEFASPAGPPLNSGYVALAPGRITAVSVRGSAAPVVDIVINTVPAIVGLPVGLSPIGAVVTVAPGDLIEASLASAGGPTDIVVELLIEA